ncbi:tyrosine-type recombinase/integrase [Micromonospora sp. WMMA2032]|uniref:tyrosine-type recombinase/integrase n=1 Tax=Micromonospora sp. WMMA2032 TaxID=2039870 RepID=UPI0020A5F0E1|nr:tyrosine-type recombinase/integrase [Micromonospora sp. WMMA2032]
MGLAITGKPRSGAAAIALPSTVANPHAIVMAWLSIDRAYPNPARRAGRCRPEAASRPSAPGGAALTRPLLTLMEHRERQQAERAALSEVWEDQGPVFPSERGTPMEPTNLSRSFARLRETAGLPGVRLHDLRHTVVSLLMELGVPPHVVQAIARHADVKVTLKVYAHANLDAMRQALGKLDGRLS